MLCKFTMVYSDVGEEALWVNPILVTCIEETKEGTKIYFTGGDEDYAVVKEPISEVTSTINTQLDVAFKY